MNHAINVLVGLGVALFISGLKPELQAPFGFGMVVAYLCLILDKIKERNQ